MWGRIQYAEANGALNKMVTESQKLNISKFKGMVCLHQGKQYFPAQEQYYQYAPSPHESAI